MKKIGVIGGSFNPIHNAHIALAQKAYEQYGLDEVIFMPAGIPYYKTQNGQNEKYINNTYNDNYIETANHRLDMVRLAILDLKYAVCSDLELSREGNTYTADTLEQLAKSGDQYYFIIGEDAFLFIDLWFRPEVIFDHCTLLVCSRSGEQHISKDMLVKRIKNLKKLYPNARIEIVDGVDFNISSSKIRKKISKGQMKAIYDQMPKAVLKYICQNHLYGIPLMEEISDCDEMPEDDELRVNADQFTLAMSLDKINQSLKKRLDDKRYIHTKGVEYTSICLAMRYHIDLNKARLAGLLHDCAKYGTDEAKIEKCRKNNVVLSEVEIKNPALIHGKLGAFYAAKRYGITDADIINAISYHTTGRPNMSMLEKIVYIADYIEPGRKMLDGLALIRQEAFINIDRAVYLTAKNTIEYLDQKNGIIDDTTRLTYEYYKKLVEHS